MLRISKMTDYGVMVMVHMARSPSELFNAAQIAAQTGVSVATAGKLLKELAKQALLVSYRGARGGYRLARGPESISVLEIIDAIEGPLGLTECSTDEGACHQEPVCPLRGNWSLINQAVRNSLTDITLEQMARPMDEPAPAVPLIDYRMRFGSS